MALTLARTAVAVFEAWVALGALFALAFTAIGAARIDPEARGSSVGFRALIFPASVALWPLILWRWVRGSGSAPQERNSHRDRARELER